MVLALLLVGCFEPARITAPEKCYGLLRGYKDGRVVSCDTVWLRPEFCVGTRPPRC